MAVDCHGREEGTLTDATAGRRSGSSKEVFFIELLWLWTGVLPIAMKTENCSSEHRRCASTPPHCTEIIVRQASPLQRCPHCDLDEEIPLPQQYSFAVQRFKDESSAREATAVLSTDQELVSRLHLPYRAMPLYKLRLDALPSTL